MYSGEKNIKKLKIIICVVVASTIIFMLNADAREVKGTKFYLADTIIITCTGGQTGCLAPSVCNDSACYEIKTNGEINPIDNAGNTNIGFMSWNLMGPPGKRVTVIFNLPTHLYDVELGVGLPITYDSLAGLFDNTEAGNGIVGHPFDVRTYYIDSLGINGVADVYLGYKICVPGNTPHGDYFARFYCIAESTYYDTSGHTIERFNVAEFDINGDYFPLTGSQIGSLAPDVCYETKTNGDINPMDAAGDSNIDFLCWGILGKPGDVINISLNLPNQAYDPVVGVGLPITYDSLNGLFDNTGTFDGITGKLFNATRTYTDSMGATGEAYVFIGYKICVPVNAPAGDYFANFYCTTTGSCSYGTTVSVSEFKITSTGVKLVTTVMPYEYKLFHNYPNPFNPTTNIRYDIPQSQYVTLKVYDQLGRVTATLIDRFQQAGTYEISFDASGIPSGMYYYRLMAGSYSKVMKMMVLR